MNLTFFAICLLIARTGQVLEPQAEVASNGVSITDQLAEAERQVQSFRSSWVARSVATGPDGKPVPVMEPNEKLMTLESVVSELEMDALGKESLWRQLQHISPEQLTMTPELQVLLANDPLLVRYETDLQRTEQMLRRAKQQFGNKHRVVTQFEQQYQVARLRFDEETATKTLTFNNQLISQAQQSHIRSQEMVCKANDQLDRVKAEQRDKDTQMAEYLRLVEVRDTLRLKLAEEQETLELARLRGLTLDELKAAVNQANAALEKAQRAHQRAVAVLNEAVERPNQGGSVDKTRRPDSKPAGE